MLKISDAQRHMDISQLDPWVAMRASIPDPKKPLRDAKFKFTDPIGWSNQVEHSFKFMTIFLRKSHSHYYRQ